MTIKQKAQRLVDLLLGESVNWTSKDLQPLLGVLVPDGWSLTRNGLLFRRDENDRIWLDTCAVDGKLYLSGRGSRWVPVGENPRTGRMDYEEVEIDFPPDRPLDLSQPPQDLKAELDDWVQTARDRAPDEPSTHGYDDHYTKMGWRR